MEVVEGRVEYEVEVYKVRGELPRWEQTKVKKAQVVMKRYNRAEEGISHLLNKKQEERLLRSQVLWPEGSGINEAAAWVSVRQHTLFCGEDSIYPR